VTPQQARRIGLNTHVSGIALTRAVDSYCAVAGRDLPTPKTGFKWQWIGPKVKGYAPKSPGWPCRHDEFVEVYAGSLVGFA
jgi:hypothetical protein